MNNGKECGKMPGKNGRGIGIMIAIGKPKGASAGAGADNMKKRAGMMGKLKGKKKK